MVLLGTFYRCQLLTFGGPQTTDVMSRWTRNLEPIGEHQVLSGKIVELFVEIGGTEHALTRRRRSASTSSRRTTTVAQG